MLSASAQLRLLLLPRSSSVCSIIIRRKDGGGIPIYKIDPNCARKATTTANNLFGNIIQTLTTLLLNFSALMKQQS